MKRLKLLGIGGLCSFLLVAGAPGMTQAKVVLRMATEGQDNPPPEGIKHPIPDSASLKRFARLIKERSKGEMEVELFFGTMGPAKQLFASATLGTLDIVAFDTGILSYFKGGENFSVLWAPYLFHNVEEFNGWIDSDMAKGMMGPIEKNMKIKVLGPIYWRTNRMISTTDTPVWTVDDMKGLKIRVPPSRIFNEVFSAWGAIPTPMAFAELFMALKQGVVQGQDNGWDVLVGYQFYNVQKYAMISDHGMAGYLLAINQAKWDSLTPEQRKLIDDVRREVYAWQIPLFRESLTELTQYAASHGMRVIIPDLTGFRKIANDLNMKLDQDGSIWEKGLYKKTQDWLIQNFRQ
jgi:tripartite ATP-independent transporter DctP family solute receptor